MKEFSSVDAAILLLESDPVTRTVLCEALRNAGYLVATASNLGTAIERLEEVRPDLLIIPPYINSMPGHIAADYLRSKQPGLPVLVVAGFPDDDRITIRNSIRGFHTFPSPFNREEFIAKVREVLKYQSKMAA